MSIPCSKKKLWSISYKMGNGDTI